MSEAKRYRVVFETANPHQVDAYEQRYGKDCWPRMAVRGWEALALDWHEVVNEGGEGILEQHATLAQWERDREQPIRNVRLFEQPAAEWVPVESEEA